VSVRDGDLETLLVDDLPPHRSPRRPGRSLRRLGRTSRHLIGVIGAVAAVGLVIVLTVAVVAAVVSRVRSAASDGMGGAPRRVAIWTGDGRLDVVDRVTGSHRTIARDSPARPGTAALAASPDGRTLFFDRLAPSFAVECGSTISNAEEVVSVPVVGGPIHLYGRGEFPTVSPDGRWLAFATRTDGSCAPEQNIVAFVELGVSPMRIYRAPLIVDSPDVGARGVRIARLSWDPDSQSVAVAGSFAFSVSPLVVRTTDAVNETAATAARLPLPFSDRVAYRGNRRQLFEVDGNGVVVDAEQALPAHELFRLRHIQVATTDASGRYFLAVDASSRVFGWRPGLEKPRRLGSLEGASATWIPDHDSTRLPTVDVADSGSIDEAIRMALTFCPGTAGRMSVRLPGDVRAYSCDSIRRGALRDDLQSFLRSHVAGAKNGDRFVELNAMARGTPDNGRVRGALEWSYAVRDPGGCSRPRRVSETHRLISKDRNETPEEWTLVEALPIGAACPQRLDDLYAAVRAAGYSDAAQAVRNRMRVLLATVDGEHFPRNVATRLGHRDWM